MGRQSAPQPRGSGRRQQHAQPAASQPAQPDVLTIQRGRFVQWQPSPVICSAATADGTVAVVGREDGEIELLDTLSWQPLKRIPGGDQAVLSAVVWVKENAEADGERLVSGGLDGSLTEWDLTHLRPMATTDSLGGAVWALAVQPPQAEGICPDVAVACDDGVLRLFGPHEAGPGLQYRRSFGRVEGRVLSVAWHPSGTSLVSGHSDGCIRAWDAASGREIYRITAGKGSCVWAVLVLPDGTLVSGESSGHVRFWDGRFGTLVAEFSEHKADVLALAASPAGDAVFAAGVDPRLALFQRTGAPATGMDAWQYTVAKRPHTHDVRTLLTLASAGEAPLLLSGGNDAQLLAHSCDAFMQHHPTRVCRIPQRPLTSAAGSAPGAGVTLVSAHAANVDIWRLPPARQAEDGSNSIAPVHLARISNKSGRHILAAALSADCARVALSDVYQMRAYNLQSTSGSISGQMFSIAQCPLPDGTDVAHQLLFAPDGRLLAAAADGRIDLIDLKERRVVRSFSEAAAGSGGPGSGATSTMLAQPGAAATAHKRQQPAVAALAVGSGADGAAWAAAASGSTVHLFSLADDNPSHAGRLLLPGEAAVAAAFSPTGNMLAVATASKTVHVFDIAARRPTPWMTANAKALQASLDKVPGPILGLSLDPTPQTASLLIAMPHAFCHVNLLKDLGHSRKRRRQAAHVLPEDAALHAANVDNFRAAKLGNPCLLMEYTGAGTAMLLEHDWADAWASVPPPMYRHRYGT